MNSEEKIINVGSVLLDLSFYSDNDYYSDGDIEDVMLNSCIGGRMDEILNTSGDYAVLYHFSETRHNIIEWYPFTGGESVLEIGSGCGAVTGIISDKSKNVTCVELSKKRSMINAHRNSRKKNIYIYVGNFQDIEPELKKYDIITLIGVWEYSELYINDCKMPYIEMLNMAKKHLKPNGNIIIAIENKMGLKYFNGAWEDHTCKQYSGLNDYIGDFGVRTFSINDVKDMLSSVGFNNPRFHYPVPDYKLPEKIYSDYFLPKPGEIRIFHKDYNLPRLYNFYEDTVYDQICHDKRYSYFSNSFLISVNGYEDGVIYTKYNRDRKKEYQIATKIEIINGKKSVVKYPLNEVSQKHISRLVINEEKCNGIYPNIKNIKGFIESNYTYKVPYISGRTIDETFYVLRHDINAFLEKAKEYIELYLSPKKNNLIDFYITEDFNKIFGNVNIEHCMSTKYTNIDMIFSNIIIDDNGEACVFDFEWVFGFPIPFRYTIWRVLESLYIKYNVYLKPQIDRKAYFVKMGITETEQLIFEKMEKNFCKYVYGDGYMSHYIKNGIMPITKIY